PKSGNTWLRFMIYTALFGEPKSSIDIARKIPDIHRQLPMDPPENNHLFAKTHLALTENHPKLDETIRAIHIIRNPRDVLLSALNYRKMTAEGAAQIHERVYAEQFIANGGDPDWKIQGHADWATNARSWRTTTRFPVLQLRYELFKTNPETELRKLLTFLEIDHDDALIARVLKATSFDAMRALEIREKHDRSKSDLNKRLFVGSQRAATKGAYFMNAGKSNQSLDAVAPGLDEKFNEAFADALQEFGYSS
ncbi:MAG: sulfotransferase domain-containing protein, partial [Phycisphaerales bacterium]|nr:sulfotransferase domain-containing protein [Phycisphaerales bacterium]